MKFSIGAQFSREFTHNESNIPLGLTEELNVFFKEKGYGKKVMKIYRDYMCF